jgi:hypothetical protein
MITNATFFISNIHYLTLVVTAQATDTKEGK